MESRTLKSRGSGEPKRMLALVVPEVPVRGSGVPQFRIVRRDSGVPECQAGFRGRPHCRNLGAQHRNLGPSGALRLDLPPLHGNRIWQPPGPLRNPQLVAATDEPVGWSTGGRAVIVATRTIPTRLERVELSTGTRRVLRELRPPGLEGVRVSVWSVTADGEQFAYNGIRQSRTLYVVK